jgi:hypothetical protein
MTQAPGDLFCILARIFSPLTDPFYIFGQLFSDLVSKNTELLASLASVLKNLSIPLLHGYLRLTRQQQSSSST